MKNERRRVADSPLESGVPQPKALEGRGAGAGVEGFVTEGVTHTACSERVRFEVRKTKGVSAGGQ